ncbi:MAG: type II secretion system protein GspK [Methylacidiphilales bacterium]|nr:type II secretion system protein GspK [Candidatus Methylacidiphilales bacterium]
MKARPPFFTRRKGSALLIVLWAIAIMSAAILGVVEFVNIGFDEAATKGKDFRALQLAESGIALGLHPKVRKRESVLHQTFDASESFDVKLRSEGARLNINVVLLRDQRDVLLDLFDQWGVKSQDAMRTVDCLMDWVDADSLKRLNGAEQPEYAAIGLPDLPPNRPFQSVDEMEMVLGMDVVAKAKPDWKNYFTVWGDGKLDLNEAPADLIEAVCNVGARQAENLVQYRLGPDGVVDTDDDVELKDLSQVQSSLGLTNAAFQALQDRITLKSDYRRIESTGMVGSYKRTIIVVTHLNSNPIQYLSWFEQ